MSTPQAVVHRVASTATDWLAGSREFFSAPTDIPEVEWDVDTVLKPLVELALAASFVLREGVAGTRQIRACRELLECSWRWLRHGEVLYRVQIQEPAATYPLEFYSVFAATGRRHRGLDGLLRHVRGTRSPAAQELMPTRELAVLRAWRDAGFAPYDEPTRVAARTWLGRTPEPWTIDTTAAYAVTHAVFHLTDLGRAPQAMPPPLRDYLDSWLPVWCEVWAEAEDWDLLGELLIVDLCLPQPHVPPRIWQRYADAQRPDGLMPRGGSPAPQTAREDFVDHYHSTVVAVLAGTLALSRDIEGGVHEPC
ncbi:DUF6895 family protein [Actinosynnema sp. NPDC053489]|uniref:DUF6895 family protein n=1 Tax=Actinosynnema sp. NPDC053489 TaxID=3363916 RepID=UPI0037CA215F